MREVGGYTLAGRLASGGLGDPYLARAVDQTVVVIKAIHPALAVDLNFGRVFDLESSSAVPFSHPRHINVFEASRESGAAWIAREFVPGVSLADLLRMAMVESVAISHDSIAHLGAQLADLLLQAHDRPWFDDASTGMLHAGLSPRHLLLDWDGRLHIAGIGFGHARQLCEPVATAVPFLAPEVADGKEPSAATDCYGLGAVLHAAFTGKVAYRRSTPEATRVAVKEGRAAPITPTRLTIDPEVSDLVASMMVQRQSARPSLSEVASGLRQATSKDEDDAQAELQKVLSLLFAEEKRVQLRKAEATVRSGSSTRVIISEPPTVVPPEAAVTMEGQAPPVGAVAPTVEVLSPTVRGEAPPAEPVSEPKPGPASDAAVTVEAQLDASVTVPDTPAPAAETVEASAPDDAAAAVDKTPADDEVHAGSGSVTADLLASHDLPTFPSVPPKVAKPVASTDLVAENGAEPSGDLGDDGRAPTEWSTDLPEERRPPPDLHGPSRLGRYNVKSLISRSDSTARYVARDPNLRRDVEAWVLDPKRLADPRLANADWVRWFKAEVSFQARVDHPAFPAVLDAGRSEGIYFASYVHRPLARLATAKGRLAPRTVLLEVASAVAAAHEQGIVLGQIDEDVVGVDASGHVRLRPLELASEPGAGHPLLGQKHSSLTPEYIRQGQVSFASDQFALGLLVYRIATGRDPFPESPGIRKEALLDLDPAPPEGDDHDFNEVVMRMLSRDPEARFSSIEVAAKSLERRRIPARDAALCAAWRSVTELAPGIRGSPVAEELAASMSQAMLLSPPTQSTATMAAAGLALARTLGKKVTDTELQELWPPHLVAVMAEAIARVQADEPEPSTAPAAEVAGLAFSLSAALALDASGIPKKSPTDIIRALEAQRGTRWSTGAVDAAVAAVRTHHSVGEVEPVPPSKRVVLFQARDALAQLLEFDGFGVDRVDDFDAALAQASGAQVVVANFQLAEACRQLDPNDRPAVVLLGDDDEMSEVWMAEDDVQVVAASTSDEVIRAHVVRLSDT